MYEYYKKKCWNILLVSITLCLTCTANVFSSICKVHVVFQKKKGTLIYLQASFTIVHRQNAATSKLSRCSVICMRTGDF